MRELAAVRLSPLAEAFAAQCRRWMAVGQVPEYWHVPVAQLAGDLMAAVEAGHVCLDVPRHSASRLPGLPPLGPEWRACGLIRLPGDAAGSPMVLDGQRLYLARHYVAEVHTAQRLQEMAQAQRLCILSGGPGTGKTTTVARLLGRLLAQRPASRIVLAAPTGKAAARMMEALQHRLAEWPAPVRRRMPDAALTLHRLLGWQMHTGLPKANAENPLALDVLIVDEASMLDQTLAAALLAALPKHAMLILLGDKDQLAAVEAGAVFAELSDVPGCLPADSQGLDAWLDQRLGLGESAASRPHILAAQAAARAAATKAAQRRARRQQALADVQGDLFGEPTPGPAVHEGSSEPLVSEESVSVQDSGPLAACVAWLQTSYRFAGDSRLGRVAAAVRDGDVLRAMHELRTGSRLAEQAGADCAWLAEEGDSLSAVAHAWLQAGYQPYWQTLAEGLLRQRSAAQLAPQLLAAFDTFRVLVAVHGGGRGGRVVNHELATAGLAYLRAQGVLQLGDDRPQGERWGQPVLILENHAATGLFNGDVGVLLPDEAQQLSAWFPPLSQGQYRRVPLAALPRHDLAYALTVHKSQGSEFERVALVLPGVESPVLTRELVYTALTRAKQGVAVLASADRLATAIASPTERESGLSERLVSALPVA